MAGGLEFMASGGTFTAIGTRRSLPPGASVSIGFAPGSQQDFKPLLELKLDDDFGSFSLETAPSQLSFTVNVVELDAVAVESKNGAVPIPIWRNGGTETFSIPKLLSMGGVDLSSGTASPITVAHCQFQLTTLNLGKPSSSAPGGQILMRGTIDLNNVPVLGKVLDTATVGGTNYVVIDASGVSLTGLSVSKSLPSDTVIGGFKVSGDVTVGYGRDRNSVYTITAGGGVAFTSTSQSWVPQGLSMRPAASPRP